MPNAQRASCQNAESGGSSLCAIEYAAIAATPAVSNAIVPKVKIRAAN